MDSLTASQKQQMMQLIVRSSKATTQAMQAIKEALAGDITTARESLEGARHLSVEAHNVQTQMIQAEIRGESSQTTLLAVHAQDHFMNSHLLLEMASIILEQQQQLEDLKTRLTKLEQVGETHESSSDSRNERNR